jgi:hypothetical protein
MIPKSIARVLLFFGVCIVVRVGLALAAKVVGRSGPLASTLMGIVGLAVGIRFIMLYSRRGPQTSAIFKDKAWWHNLRLVHGLMYILFGILAISNYKAAWVVLLADALLGAAVFIMHHALGVTF